MRRFLGLVLLAGGLLAQTPVACLAAGHPSAAGVDESASGDPHAHHARGSDSAPKHDADDNATPQRQGDTELPCAAVARCHWSALPQPGVPALEANGRICSGSDGASPLPVGAISPFPTPPPRPLS